MAQQLASYVPRLVLARHAGSTSTLKLPEQYAMQGAVLFADISGFTPLTEKMNGLGQKGIEMMATVLNDFFDKLLGDVIKFAGDALLAVWPQTETLGSVVLLASQCALNMQEQLKGYVAQGCSLTLHSGIGAGPLTGLHVGGHGGRVEYLVTGAPLEQVSEGEKRAQPGQVCISHEAWTAVQESRPHSLRVAVINSKGRARRKTALTLSKEQLLAHIAAYCPAPITRRLEAQGPLLYENRRISVLFVNIDLVFSGGEKRLRQLQQGIVAMQTVIFRLDGEVRQFLVDDKGSVLIAVWGLPTRAHEDDTERAVLAALQLQAALVPLKLRTRIGATTGPAFCGDVGNAQRREFAMVGDTVNLSARLMGACEWGSVLCDASTRTGAAKSKALSFTALPPIMVKGKSKPIEVFEPRETEKSSVNFAIRGRFTIRDKSLRTLRKVGTINSLGLSRVEGSRPSSPSAPAPLQRAMTMRNVRT